MVVLRLKNLVSGATAANMIQDIMSNDWLDTGFLDLDSDSSGGRHSPSVSGRGQKQEGNS